MLEQHPGSDSNTNTSITILLQFCISNLAVGPTSRLVEEDGDSLASEGSLTTCCSNHACSLVYIRLCDPMYVCIIRMCHITAVFTTVLSIHFCSVSNSETDYDTQFFLFSSAFFLCVFLSVFLKHSGRRAACGFSVFSFHDWLVIL